MRETSNARGRSPREVSTREQATPKEVLQGDRVCISYVLSRPQLTEVITKRPHYNHAISYQKKKKTMAT